MSTSTGDRDPPDLSPREAMERFIDKKRVSNRESSVSSVYYRLKLFVEWCEEEGLDVIGDLTGWDLESYETHRRSRDLAPITLQKELLTLKNFLEYCERIEVAPDGLADRVEPPTVPQQKQSSDIRLAPEDALALIRAYRSKPGSFGERGHLLLELAWTSGARMGAIRGLDIRDVDTETGTVRFHHRPDTGTPLKNGLDGERPIAIGADVCGVINRYISQYRDDVHDEHGRQPLLTTTRGRPSTTTVRNWMYFATVPCHAGPCPHERDPKKCDWLAYTQATHCPSSRAPHHVRTGAITWMRNRGMPVEVVAKRVNASVKVIEKHHDKENPDVELDERRREFASLLDVDDDAEDSISTDQNDSSGDQT